MPEMATTHEQNQRLTQIGPGTLMGSLLRCYWHPVGVAVDLEKNPVKSIRVLGEDLTLFRDRSGNYGLVGQRCAHRQIDLRHGVPEVCGLRCAYHGWASDASGQCMEQPLDATVHPRANYN